MVAGTAQANDRYTVAGTHPAWAGHKADRGLTDSSQRIDAKVWLSGRDPKGLDAYALAVSTPGNALYRHFLTPKQFNQHFGATKVQVDAVTNWIRSSGLYVDLAGSNSHYLHVTGHLDKATKAFGTNFHNYNVRGKVVRAPEGDATVPSSVASSVLTIEGLNTFKTVRTHDDQLPPPEPNFWVSHPCDEYYGQNVATAQPEAFGKHQPYAQCGVKPKQMRNAYAGNSTLTGKGVTVAVVDAYAAPNVAKVENQFAKAYGATPFATGQYREVLPKKFDNVDLCDAAGWYGEEMLDITAVHDVAPDANIVYAGAKNCLDGLDDSLLNIVDKHLADIVTNSWGSLTEYTSQDQIDTEEAIFKQGATEGIGFYFSTGDCGYEAPGTPCQARYGDQQSTHNQTDWPTSSVWATAVGGTSLAVDANDQYKFEAGWNFSNDALSADGTSWNEPPPGNYPGSYSGGSGGGTTTYPQPDYQKGVVPDSLSKTLADGSTSATPMRTIPDLAADADSTTGIRYPAWVQLTDGSFGYAESRVGGTSLACPLVAGAQALAQQAAGAPIGFANPAIYLRANKGLTHDVTDHPLGNDPVAFVRTDYTDPSTQEGPITYKLRTTGNFGIPASDALPATTGYDEITGIGTPTAAYESSFK
jgi:subtilase family serine protease